MKKRRSRNLFHQIFREFRWRAKLRYPLSSPPSLLESCNRSTKVKFRAKISSEISLLLIKKFFDLSSALDLPDIRNVNIRYDVPTLIACPRRV